ncbi:leucine-rich repeat-containing protein 3-like [Corythoichthys intestinalis]|uniref:leucine-rich repeat-containing protein 3-like n=1 Tax=Corythoichthys intestinalis TaxID=161448 RepID=UPI0025A593F3|nr:leucine-rich repeat-containing protein 3-like [Corythoichthys intestinalis]XP_061814053.1 leucine-rich repeat-containing protein 3-like [Nerophis lumbriciformis]
MAAMEKTAGKRRPRRGDAARWLCGALFFFSLWIPVRPQCPEGCHCTRDTATVLCSDAGLREVPEGIPEDTVSLHLERNDIRSLPENAFAQLARLRDLHLAHNRIDSLSSGALRRLGPELRLLDLSHNQLRQASRDEFGGTRAKTRLYHNPWRCDCSLQELMESLNLEPETVNGIVCESSARGPGELGRWEDPVASGGEHAGQPLVRLLDSGVNFCSLHRKTTDVAMLVTMFVWFFMVIVYVVYYVRQNQAEARRHLEYLKSLPSPRKTPTETDTLSTGF